MSDEEKNDDEGKPKMKLFDISQFIPKIEHGDTIYISTVTSTATSAKLRKVFAEEEEMLPEDFTLLLVQQSIRPKGSDVSIASELASELASDKVFLEKLIAAHPELYSEWDRQAGGENAERSVLLERAADEPAPAFLLRAFKGYDERRIAQTEALNKKLRRQYEGLAGSLSDKGLDALIRGNSASARIQDMIGSSASDHIRDIIGDSPSVRLKDLMGKNQPSLTEQALGSRFSDDPYLASEPLRLPEMPRNPIYETNEILADVASSTEEMRELYFQQAEMQQNLNTVATEILDKFVTGSKDAARSSRNALLVAGLAIAAPLIPFFYGVFYDRGSEVQIASQERIEAVLVELKDEVQTNGDQSEEHSEKLIQAIEDLETAIEEDQRGPD